MRNSMRPITIGRIIEVSYLATQSNEITPNEVRDTCGVSIRRAKEIMSGMIDMKLLQDNEARISKTESCVQFIRAIRTGNWDIVHHILMEYPFYKDYYHTIEVYGPLTPEQILEKLTESSLSFNKASIDVLSDWVERIGSIQKNVFTNNYYVVKPLERSFLPMFLEVYNKLNVKVGIALRKRYVEIPKLREYLCEEQGISRAVFDIHFINLCQKNVGIIELSGAPLTTHAKITKKRIKNIAFSEMPECITMDISSDRVLQGVEVMNKQYYYVAIHGSEIIE